MLTAMNLSTFSAINNPPLIVKNPVRRQYYILPELFEKEMSSWRSEK